MLWERMIPPLEQLSLPQLSVFSPNRAKRHFWTDGILSLVANRSSFLIGELLLGKLSEAVVVQSNAPHDRPGFFVSHLIGNRASFLCTKAPMLRVPETNFLQGITSISGCGSSADLLPPSPPAEKEHSRRLGAITRRPKNDGVKPERPALCSVTPTVIQMRRAAMRNPNANERLRAEFLRQYGKPLERVRGVRAAVAAPSTSSIVIPTAS